MHVIYAYGAKDVMGVMGDMHNRYAVLIGNAELACIRYTYESRVFKQNSQPCHLLIR